MVTEFEELYNPIIGATSDGYGREPLLTPQAQLDRTNNLKLAYAELKADLLDEVNMVDQRIIRPATDAKEHIKPIKKTIKNRENKRIDYENYQDRVEKKKKQKLSEREEAGLIKLEADMAKAADVRTKRALSYATSLTSSGLPLCRRSFTRNPAANNRSYIFYSPASPGFSDHDTKYTSGPILHNSTQLLHWGGIPISSPAGTRCDSRMG